MIRTIWSWSDLNMPYLKVPVGESTAGKNLESVLKYLQ